MSETTGVWNIAGKNPFLVFLANNEVKSAFMSEYTPQNGFGIFLATKGYKVYTNTYVFNAVPFTTSDGIIGINVIKGFPMNQSQTLEAAVKRVQVIGLPKDYFCMKGERNPYIAENGATELLRYVDSESSKKQADIEVNNEKQIAFIDRHEAIIRCKQEFEETRLFSVDYSKFEDSLQNIQDGVVYKFAITIENDEKTEEKFQENTGVEISANDQGMPVLGTIVEEKDGWLYIKFHDMGNSYNRIAVTGSIKERSNPEYRFKLDALELLKKDLSPNKYLLSILADGKIEPFRIRKRYMPYDITEKDGTVHKNVNPSQKEAIEKALNVNDFLLVQGPPGTGKTTIITEMIEDFVKQGLRVLICSKNNLAVDNVLEKCQDLFYDENNTRKMQCLRLGNEEKVLPSIRGSLPRPLTQKIQNDVKLQSNSARTAYLESEQLILQRYEQAIKDTKKLCLLTKYFLGEKTNYAKLLDAFQKSKWTIFLGKKRKEQFLKELVFLSQQIDVIVKQLLALMQYANINVQSKAVQQYLQLTHNIYDAMELLKQEINTASLRYGFILRDEKATTLSEIESSNQKKEDILKSMCTLSEYKGNPAAQEMRLSSPVGEITADYVDRFHEEAEKQINVLKKRRLLLKNVLDEWHSELESDQSSLEEPLLRTVKIIGATCIGVNTKNNFKNVEYDVAIVDEAGQITCHDLLVPLVKAKKIILIGDHLQLPPGEEKDFCDYVQEKKMLGFEDFDDEEDIKEHASELGKVFSVSLFERLFRDPRFDNNKVMLDTQFRMHPDIAEFISEQFYDGKYKSGVSAESRRLKIAGFNKPMYFIDTNNIQNKHEEINGKSYINVCEADICAELLSKVIVAIENNDYELGGKTLKEADGEYDIGVITAYKKQIPLIRNKTKELLLKYYESERTDDIISHLTINTLDSFQGRDNQIIFYSFVRSNEEKQIGFLKEVRRLNVMMTRAKSLLVMIGDSTTLTQSRSYTVHERKRASDYYKALVEYCKNKYGYIDYANGGFVNE